VKIVILQHYADATSSILISASIFVG